jgi:hypothetical protein
MLKEVKESVMEVYVKIKLSELFWGRLIITGNFSVVILWLLGFLVL